MMDGLSPADILWVWEWGSNRHSVDRALLILAASDRDRTHAQLAELTVGQRDARLLRLHAGTFGSRLDGCTTCPSCAAELEFAVECDGLGTSPENEKNEPFELQADDYRLTLRCLDSRDVADASRSSDLAAARRFLIDRAVIHAERGAESVPARELPDSILELASNQIRERDSAVDISLDFRCPECGRKWEADLDIVTFLWTEIATHARRLCHEVHTLAKAYGWHEDSILALSPRRRRAYLDMAG